MSKYRRIRAGTLVFLVVSTRVYFSIGESRVIAIGVVIGYNATIGQLSLVYENTIVRP